ncbi:hypothetical protein HIM_07172 [Hirsutella minnesotensis 3608]|uniref:DUF2423 domain-containing protein n=1 Tax=Hirsutella minnesotensis 3608 TaxID=1043627 RepID=A0A0F7ZTM6_9HYPO|nr:hypothetical protein HIM_07172 [Hirsutella minnesotensis 3608]
MAKSSRSSTKKENNRRKAAAVFGPAELARDERLSAKLLELAKQPKPEPVKDVNMNEKEDDAVGEDQENDEGADDTVMDVDGKQPARATKTKKRIEKRRQKKGSIVFPKYSDKLASRKKKSKVSQ